MKRVSFRFSKEQNDKGFEWLHAQGTAGAATSSRLTTGMHPELAATTRNIELHVTAMNLVYSAWQRLLAIVLR